MKQATKLLHTPPGGKALFKEEALLRHTIRNKMIRFFEDWNFFPFETPVFDYYDVYASALNERQRRGSLRFVNQEGELVLLRNDITLFASKSLASRTQAGEENIRYYYADQIVRSHRRNTPEEYYQIGCEIVFDSLSYEELELVVILLESTELLGLTTTLLHICDVSVLQFLLQEISKKDSDAILHAIRTRDQIMLAKLLASSPIGEEKKADIIVLAKFIGFANEFSTIELSQSTRSHLQSFYLLLNSLNEMGYGERVVIDFSEVTDLDYYSGLVFNVYGEGAETPLASGGRYDKLLEQFGLPKKAVGFSYWLYPLEKLLAASTIEIMPREDIDIGEVAPTQAFAKAVALIKQGKAINLHY